MGNNCAGVRDSANKNMETAGAKFANAKAYTKDSLEVGKMRVQGFKVRKIEDTSQMACITDFQQSLPLSRMSLNEYERRLKKLLDPEAGDEISKQQLIECFKDHYAFKEIADEGSAVHKIMTDDALKKGSETTYHVPYLMLLGLLICATNDQNKCDKFFELC